MGVLNSDYTEPPQIHCVHALGEAGGGVTLILTALPTLSGTTRARERKTSSEREEETGRDRQAHSQIGRNRHSQIGIYRNRHSHKQLESQTEKGTVR